jgi:hypothetical protein
MEENMTSRPNAMTKRIWGPTAADGAITEIELKPGEFYPFGIDYSREFDYSPPGPPVWWWRWDYYLDTGSGLQWRAGEVRGLHYEFTKAGVEIGIGSSENGPYTEGVIGPIYKTIW